MPCFLLPKKKMQKLTGLCGTSPFMLARLRVTIAARVDQKVRDQAGNGEGAHARSVPTEVDGAGR